MKKPAPKTDIVRREPTEFPAELGLKHGENTLVLTIDYTKGGTNMFSGNRIKRGYFFRVSAVKNENGMMSFMLFGTGYGRAFLLGEANRFDARKLAALDAAIAPHFPAIEACALRADYDGIRELLTAAVRAIFPPPPAPLPIAPAVATS